MSNLRPECIASNYNSYCPQNGTAYLMIYNAVRNAKGLIFGRLHDYRGRSCAIGRFFDVNPSCALPYSIIDEVAAINDSSPTVTPHTRKLRVARWLRWKLKKLGIKP